MKVIYSPDHKRHAPRDQFIGGALRPNPEVPARAEAILRAIQGRHEVMPPRTFSMDAIRAVHDAGYLRFLEHVHTAWVDRGGAGETGLIPDTFAARASSCRPRDLVHQAGYYGFETQTPILENTFTAAREAAYCALSGAAMLLEDENSVYALCRPPGHHAAGDLYGGYCYLNHAAAAAKYLCAAGRVAVLDVDYHHGNGTQSIFYGSEAVLFVSIHADPDCEYPWFSGHTDETGTGAGLGLNVNLPLAIGSDETRYLEALDRALNEVDRFAPAFLVVSLGVDACREDPLGKFDLPVSAFETIGRRLARADLPTLLVQEGGYDLDSIGACVQNVLDAFGR
ncbi:MAG: histone deacetylase family protein [Gemmatimonadota bacterium]|nr:histone deacetylase family protein [Gemmatimonadota bacterium]